MVNSLPAENSTTDLIVRIFSKQGNLAENTLTYKTMSNCMNKKILAVLLLLPASAVHADGSPWIAGDGETTISVDVTGGSTRDFFLGETSIDLGGELKGTYTWFNGNYGYDDVWAFDIRTGYAETSLEGSNGDQNGVTDTTLGASYQFTNEFESDNGLPTVTGRLAYTIGGDYDPNVIQAIGDGGSGVDLSLLVGKSLSSSFAVSADLTYRQRDNNIPDGFKYLLSGFYTSQIPGLGFRLALAGLRTDSDINFGDSQIRVDQFSQTDRDSDFLIGGVNYGFDNGIGLGFSYTALLSGKNIADTNIPNLSISYSF